MEVNIERESSTLGNLFQQIINDMKNGTPLWEDLIAKATKLHTCLRTTIQAITTFLDAFQKIADAATNSRGATKEIGTALTRICLRQKAVEARMKTFTSAIMDCLVVPLQEKLEDWKKTVFNLDREHAKDYKRARAELKKRSTDTLRLQKKARCKGATGDLRRRLETGLQDVTERRQLLGETEQKAVKSALIEERSRFCLFVGYLKPVVDEEVAMLQELTHLQDAVEQLQKHTADPYTLPAASEQVIIDIKNTDTGWTFQTPPSSPSSLGSRKSSMCSISSLNSSSSGSSKSHHSPSHPNWQRSISQPVGRSSTMRLSSVSSRDSGFTSQDALFPPRPPTVNGHQKVSNMSEHGGSNGSNASTPCIPFPSNALPNNTATWPNLQETLQFERAATAIINERPHTISSAYEKGHQRPALTVYTFQAPDQSHSQPVSPISTPTAENVGKPPNSPSSKSTQPIYARPPLPTRCSSLERPNVPAKTIAGVRVLPTGNIDHKMMKPSSLPSHITKGFAQPTYVNMHELASMAASKNHDGANIMPPPPPPEFSTPSTGTAEKTEGEKENGSTSESSLESSSGYGSQTTFPVDESAHGEDVLVCNLESAGKYCTLPRSTDLSGAPRRRPLSMTAMYSTAAMRNALLRRGSMQPNKPPPPIRRTSSITNTNRLLTPVGSMENLPPPPAFLLENNAPTIKSASSVGSVAETVKALTELKHTPASPSAVRRMSAQVLVAQHQHQHQQHHHQQQAVAAAAAAVQATFSSFQGPNRVYSPTKMIASSHMSNIYAQPSHFIHGSPTAIRKINSLRSQSADRKPNTEVENQHYSGPGGVSSGFIAALSAKLTPALSPKTSRRHSEDMSSANANSNLSSGLNQNPVKPLQKASGPGFFDTLNTKLSQPPVYNSLKASRIRQIINNQAMPNPKVCHESLMDQIKKGATLKKAKSVNDRSAPKIR